MSANEFQWVFDNMEKFSIDRQPVVGTTMSRSFNARAVSRGPAPWRFEIKVPDGKRWSECASVIKLLDESSRFTKRTVALNNPGYASWLGNTPEFYGKTWTVLCISMPRWTIFARDQVAWDGNFVFVEVPA